MDKSTDFTATPYKYVNHPRSANNPRISIMYVNVTCQILQTERNITSNNTMRDRSVTRRREPFPSCKIYVACVYAQQTITIRRRYMCMQEGEKGANKNNKQSAANPQIDGITPSIKSQSTKIWRWQRARATTSTGASVPFDFLIIMTPGR